VTSSATGLERNVAIVGAGTAGLTALAKVRKQTERFVLIDDDPLGTTCARVGCMPSKALVEASGAYHRRQVFDEMGIGGADALTVDLPAVLRAIARQVPGGARSDLASCESAGAEALG
jgi:dihydrolipoamide dehydrogenase